MRELKCPQNTLWAPIQQGPYTPHSWVYYGGSAKSQGRNEPTGGLIGEGILSVAKYTPATGEQARMRTAAPTPALSATTLSITLMP